MSHVIPSGRRRAAVPLYVLASLPAIGLICCLVGQGTDPDDVQIALSIGVAAVAAQFASLGVPGRYLSVAQLGAGALTIVASGVAATAALIAIWHGPQITDDQSFWLVLATSAVVMVSSGTVSAVLRGRAPAEDVASRLMGTLAITGTVLAGGVALWGLYAQDPVLPGWFGDAATVELALTALACLLTPVLRMTAAAQPSR